MTDPSLPRACKVQSTDNVATLLDDVDGGSVSVLGQSTEPVVVNATEAIKLGHKLALRTIPNGASVIKYGEVIGQATQDIQQGQWVHLHNCVSLFDERSKTLDVQTGAATDTRYE